MGTKFANLQIKQRNADFLIDLPPGYIIKRLSEGWITILHEDFHIGNIEDAALKLSKEIAHPVLSVGYYDDDVLVLNLFKAGKTVTTHVSDNAYGYEAKAGNAYKFVEILELEENDAGLLKDILKCENLERKISLLENLFGVCLWIKSEYVNDHGEEQFYRTRNLSIVSEYINELRTTNKINNRTKVKLITEFEGMPERREGYILPNEEGRFLLNGPLYELQQDGTLHLTSSREDEWPPTEHLGTFSDGTPLYKKGDVLYVSNTNGNRLWEFNFHYLKAGPVLHNEYIYLHCDISDENRESSDIVKLDQNGEIVAKLALPWGNCYWRTIHFNDQGRIFYVNRNNSNRVNTLYCLNDQLEIISEFILDDVSYDSMLDKRTGLLYFNIFQKQIRNFDTNSLKMHRTNKYLDYFEFISVDQQENVVIKKGSTVEILNANFDIISRHKLKGKIQDHFLNNEGNLCFVTWNGDKWDSGKEKSMIRLFEIHYKAK
ncbi:hypothetical protein [Brevibacillus sp. SYSU BS000544]|uniref:hypothetical protein n=1 Tax=Brevibacillus sp. SYSU BS000544 TaxID=3416443 RepID=UPI003CE58B91